MKRALILGISGQDGAYLAQHLINKGYYVFGSMPDADRRSFRCLQYLGIRSQVQTIQLSLKNFPAVLKTIQSLRPHEIYNLNSHINNHELSSEKSCSRQGAEHEALNVLEAIRITNRSQRFLQVTSGELTASTYPDDQRTIQNRTALDPIYEEEKKLTKQVTIYREHYGLHACTGVIYNRESPLQPSYALSRRVARKAIRIAAGYSDKLKIDNLNNKREWGWAPEYADAMWRILQCNQPLDVVIGSGESHTYEAFTEAIFASVGLDFRKHLDVNRKSVCEDGEIPFTADPTLAFEKLGWRAKIGMEAVASLLVSTERIAGIF